MDTELAAPARAKPDAPVLATAPRTAFALVLLKTPGLEVLAISKSRQRIERERRELEDASPGLEPDNLLVLEAIWI